MIPEEEMEMEDQEITSEITSPEFDAVWNLIKSWEIKIPEINENIYQSNGAHVRLILDVIKNSRPNSVRQIVKKLKYKSLGNNAKEVLIDQLYEMLNNKIII